MLKCGKSRRILTFLFATALIGAILHPEARAEDNSGNRAQWWNEARFGMFIHWGLYAYHGGDWRGKTYENAAEWLMFTAKIPSVEYRPFTRRFNPAQYNPADWVRVAKEAGMKYIVITSKHHDGFSLFESEATDYDIASTPYGKDLLKPLAEECRKQGLRFGFYYSILDWDHPDYLPRGPESPRPWDDRSTEGADLGRYMEFVKSQLKELLTNYGPIDILWFDGGWEHKPEEIDAEGLVKYIRALQPDILINNRLGIPEDFETPEQKIPPTGIPDKNWEACMTMNTSWGYKKSDDNWKSTEQLVRNLVDISSKGGNFLLNVGPKADGTFPAESIERLAEVGAWMAKNGESIYGTAASPFSDLEGARCTSKPGRLYLHVVSQPTQEILLPRLENNFKRTYLLADTDKSPIPIRRTDAGVAVDFKQPLADPIDTVIVVEIDGEAKVAAPSTDAPVVFAPGVVPAASPSTVQPAPTRRPPLEVMRKLAQEEEMRAREEKNKLLPDEEKKDVFIQDLGGSGLQLSPGWIPSGTGAVQPGRSLPAWQGRKGGQSPGR